VGLGEVQIKAHQATVPGQHPNHQESNSSGRAARGNVKDMDVSESKEFRLPPWLREIKKAPEQDRRIYAVVPSRVVKDRTLRPTAVRVLVALASYANPAGITWVGTAKVGKDLGVSGTAVRRQLAILKHRGYIEVVSPHYGREKAATRRIIFDPEISAQDAIIINSNKEDCRPPDQIRKEAKAMARKKAAASSETVTEKCSLHNKGEHQPVAEPERLTVEEGTRVFGDVVNEAELGLITQAIELGASLGMLEVCACAGDRVGALKVLLGRLERACR